MHPVSEDAFERSFLGVSEAPEGKHRTFGRGAGWTQDSMPPPLLLHLQGPRALHEPRAPRRLPERTPTCRWPLGLMPSRPSPAHPPQFC